MNRPPSLVLREPVATREDTEWHGPSASAPIAGGKAREGFQPIELLLPRLTLIERRVAFA